MLDILKNSITLAIILPLVVFAGGYLSCRLKFLQLFKLGQAFSLVSTKEKKGGMSSFGALAAILGGNLGTGNISGVAVAIVTGGPGSLFWMWVMAILAAIFKYVGCFLGVHFQQQNAAGEWVGGPMHYLRDGLNMPRLANLFCLLTVLSALTVGNLVQVHALSLPIDDFNIDPLIFGVVMAALVGGVMFGGLKTFSHVLSALVPVMAVGYVICCLAILIIFRADVGYFLALIFRSAFALEPLAGGALGYGILSAIRAGFDRGLFATDSGLGLAPIIHASVRGDDNGDDNRVVQGLISVLSPLIVMIVCTMTGLVLLTTLAYLKTDLASTSMCMEAFRVGFGLSGAGHIVSITLFFFAFTTILTWSFCSNRAVEFWLGERMVMPYKLFFIAIIPLGAYMHEQSVWTLADIATNLMFIINMVGVLGLSGIVLKAKNRLSKS